MREETSLQQKSVRGKTQINKSDRITGLQHEKFLSCVSNKISQKPAFFCSAVWFHSKHSRAALFVAHSC